MKFKHSGNLGDLIYSIPTMLELAKNKKIDLCIGIGAPTQYTAAHPAGNVQINEAAYNFIVPLLEKQKYINSITAVSYRETNVDVDLDSFRTVLPQCGYRFDYGDICRWYNYVFNTYPDLTKKWIDVTGMFHDENITLPNGITIDLIKKSIVVARSSRYRNPLINYAYLTKYEHVLFVGVPSEYDDFLKSCPHAIYVPTLNALEFALIIKMCKLFISNQTMAFSLAESMKIDRVLEVGQMCPNVIPHTKNGRDVVHHPGFINAIEFFMDKK